MLEQAIKKEEIKLNTTIRDIFKKAFESAGFEYIRPHSIRRTLARYAEIQSPAFLNAVRQNLGHKSIDTTLSSYGQQSVAEHRRNIASVQFVEERHYFCFCHVPLALMGAIIEDWNGDVFNHVGY